MVMECTERLPAPPFLKVCQYEKIKCSSPCVNGSRFCSKHLSPTSHQCAYVRSGNQCKNRIAGSEQRTLCSTHIAVKASRKRRRTEAPAHKDIVNKTPPLALHVFRIMTQERQRLKFKPNIYKRPLEHLKWVMKRERLAKNPTYPSGMESDCDEHDAPHEFLTLDLPPPIDESSMGDVTSRSVYLSQMEQRLHSRLDSLMHQVNSYKRTQQHYPTNTKAIVEAARSHPGKTTKLIQGSDVSLDAELCPCALPNPATKYSCSVCPNRALPFTKHCINHILRDDKQLLFSSCTAAAQSTSCSAPRVTAARQHCNLHSLLKRFGVARSQDIETESSSSESEAEDPVFEPCLNASLPSSPKESKKRISSPFPLPENQTNPLSEMSAMDMLPMQQDTILEGLPDEPDIPLSVRFLEPQPHPPPSKRVRTKEEEMQARAMAQYMKFPVGPGGGYYYSPYQGYPPPGTVTPVHSLQGYTKEGEPIYGYHENKQPPPPLDYPKFFAARTPYSGSGSESGSRPTTPILNPEMMHYYQQQQRFAAHTSNPGTPPEPADQQQQPPSNPPKKKSNAKKKETESTPPKPAYGTPPSSTVLTNPYSQKNGAGSPGTAASPSTMALLKSKLSEVKKDGDVEEKEEVKTPAKKKKNTPPKSEQQAPPPPQQQQQVRPQPMPQPNFYQYQQQMYQHPQHQYYLQMYMAQHPMVVPQIQGQQQQPPTAHPPPPPPPPPPASQEQPNSNGPVSKESETTHNNSGSSELNEYQKYALQQQRQRQMMIAQNQMSQYAANYPPPQHYQYYQQQQQPTPTSPAKQDKKKKKQPSKQVDKKEDSKAPLPPPPPSSTPSQGTKKPTLSSPNSKELSSLQSLMTTASSGRLPLNAQLPDEQATASRPPKPRSKKASTGKVDAGNGVKEQEMPVGPGNMHPNYAYYQGYNAALQGHVLMQMAPMKGHYVNGNTGPLYFRMEEDGQDNKPVVINDAVLARNRPSTVLMKNPGWVERYMRKPDSNDKPAARAPSTKKTPSPRRSPQKSHRNLIFHNAEIGTISDKLAKQQKNAEQRSSHRALCAKSKQQEPQPTTTTTDNIPDFTEPPPGKAPVDPAPVELSSSADGVT